MNKKLKSLLSSSILLLLIAVFDLTLFTGVTTKHAFASKNINAIKKEAETDLKNPYIMTYFKEEYENDNLSTGGDNISFEIKEQKKAPDALMITGTSKNLKSAYIKINTNYDFGTGSVNRMRIDGLAKKAANISCSFYLDDETEPFVTKQLNNQAEEGSWDDKGELFINLPENKVFGNHSITIKFTDKTTQDNYYTSLLLRSIKFYKESVPEINVNIDESLGEIKAMNESPDHSVCCYGNIEIKVPDGYQSGYNEGKLTEYKGGTYKLEYIKGRGNSTWEAPKKPYKIKLEEKANLFGMGKNKHWALLANYYDNSFVKTD